MNDFITELLQTLATKGDLNELFRSHLELAVNTLLRTELTAFLDYEKYDRTVMSRLLWPTELRVRKAITTTANKKNGHRLDNNGFHSLLWWHIYYYINIIEKTRLFCILIKKETPYRCLSTMFLCGRIRPDAYIKNRRLRPSINTW